MIRSKEEQDHEIAAAFARASSLWKAGSKPPFEPLALPPMHTKSGRKPPRAPKGSQ